ncbi:hypothetical protein [Lactobacillus delbrueckii]|uniref:hypothetical protein n=1 Tax=Lactobacillus delbrueckii TaxID=1584 RepID=UPI0023E3FEFE|nr:hypothetical protein [Lactobacillus delbrueckii]MDF4030062.1 hypothetical protein [Lactobacillus delbrueckii]
MLRSSLQIKRHTRQHYWFNVSLIVQATYLFLDGTRTLMMNRILPSNEALVNFASLCLAITLNILSYTTLMFVVCKIELPLALKTSGRTGLFWACRSRFLCEGIENRSQSDFLKEIGCQY